MTSYWSGKQLWLTGASSGIGLSLAHRLARAGARLYLSARRSDTLYELQARYPGSVWAVPGDLNNDEDLRSIITTIRAHTGHLDCVILNAGTCEYINASDIDLDSVRRTMEINFFAVAACVRAVLPLLQPTHRPLLVGVSSPSSYVGLPRAEAYGASKAAMRYFLESLRVDLHARLDVCIVDPGFVDTPLTRSNHFAMPQLMSSEQAADIMLRKLPQRPLNLRFPLGLTGALRLARLLPGVWYRLLAPRLVNSSQGGNPA